MATKEGTGNGKRFVIRLTGVKPGTRPQELASALQQLFRKKTQEEVVDLLSRLPLLLANSATETQARKVHAFLRPKGAILKITPATPPPTPAAEISCEGAVAAKKEHVPTGQSPLGEGTSPREERRAKPRVHPGIQIQPSSVWELVGQSFRLLRQNFRLFFIIMFIPQGLFFAIRHGVSLVLGTSGGTASFVGVGTGLRAFAVITFLVFLILQFWAQCALVFAVSETYLGHGASIKVSYNAIRRRSGQLFGPMLLWVVLFFMLFALAVLARIMLAVLGPVFPIEGIGGGVRIVITVIALIITIWALLRLLLNWVLMDKVVVLENMGGMRALRRADELMNARTHLRFWNRPKFKAELIVLLAFLIGIGIYQLLNAPEFLLDLLAHGRLLGSTLMGLLKVVFTSLVTSYTLMVMILYYYDIRVRKEGFDLRMMAQNL